MANSQRLDINRERDAARQQRFQNARSSSQHNSRPLFGPPVQVTPSTPSTLSQNISNVLGSFGNARQIIYSNSCIGVSDQPMTPGVGPSRIAFPNSHAHSQDASHHRSSSSHRSKPVATAPPSSTGSSHRPGVFESLSRDKSAKRTANSSDRSSSSASSHQHPSSQDRSKPPKPVESTKKDQTSRRPDEDRKSNHSLKLMMPQHKNGGAPDDLFDNILQEMSLAPPLTAINTPKKEDNSRFPFPTNKPSSPSSKPVSKAPHHHHTSSSSSSSSNQTAYKATKSDSSKSSSSKKRTEVGHKSSSSERTANTLTLSDSDDSDREAPPLLPAVDEKPPPATRTPAVSATAAVKPPSRRASRVSMSSVQLSDSSESSSSESSSDEEDDEEKKRMTEEEEEEEEVAMKSEEDEPHAPLSVEPETPPEEKSEKRWNLGSFIQVQPPSVSSPPTDPPSQPEMAPSPVPPVIEPTVPIKAEPSPAPETPASSTVGAEIHNMSIINDIIHGESFGGIDSFDEEIEIDSNLFDADSVRLDRKETPKRQVQRTPPSVSKSPVRPPKSEAAAKKKSPGRGRPPGSKTKKKVTDSAPPRPPAVKRPRTKRPATKSPRNLPSYSSSSSSDSSDDEHSRSHRIPPPPPSRSILDVSSADPPVLAPTRPSSPPAPPPAPKVKKAAKRPKLEKLERQQSSSSTKAAPASHKAEADKSLTEVLTQVSAPGLLSPIATLPDKKPDLTQLAGLEYVNGKPSVMVRLDLSLLGKYAAKIKQRAEMKPWTPSPALPTPEEETAPPLPPVKAEPFCESSIEEGEDLSSTSSSSSSSSDEDELDEKPVTPAPNPSSEDKEAISRSEKRRKNEQILSQIMDTEKPTQPPKEVKIPKRNHSSESERVSRKTKRSRRDSDRSRSRSSYRSNSIDRESHEDDRKWDRKHQWRAEHEDDRWSVTSASSHHSDRTDDSRVHNRDHDRVREHRPASREPKERHRVVHDYDAVPSDLPMSSTNTTPTYNSTSSNSVAKDWAAMMENPFSGGTPHSHRTSHEEERRPSMQKHRVAPAVDESLKSSDFYYTEARRLKHVADEIKLPREAFSKGLTYVESILYFIQYTLAMEHEQKSSTAIFTVLAKTLQFCQSISRNVQRDSAREMRLHVLRLRLQAFLSLKLYKTKKAEAARLKSVLDSHARGSSSKGSSSKQAPSPYASGTMRNSGTPSPMSPQPSPAGSTASIGSVVSPPPSYVSADNPKQSSSLASSQRIQSVTTQYVHLMEYLYNCHDIWDQSDACMQDHKDFFRNLDNDCGRLTMQSTVPEILRYIKVGLHRLKEVS